jgi:hypothetical protein
MGVINPQDEKSREILLPGQAFMPDMPTVQQVLPGSQGPINLGTIDLPEFKSQALDTYGVISYKTKKFWANFTDFLSGDTVYDLAFDTPIWIAGYHAYMTIITNAGATDINRLFNVSFKVYPDAELAQAEGAAIGLIENIMLEQFQDVASDTAGIIKHYNKKDSDMYDGWGFYLPKGKSVRFMTSLSEVGGPGAALTGLHNTRLSVILYYHLFRMG